MADRTYTNAIRAWLAKNSVEAYESFVAEGWSWDRFVEVAAPARILPALDVAALGEGAAVVPEDVQQLLDAVRQCNSERNAVAFDQLRELARSLNRIGIEPVVLKGLAYILLGIYGDPGRRFLADIDLLIPAAQMHAAVQVMENLGYSAEEEDEIERSIGHSYPALTRESSLEVDLHRTMGLGLCPLVLPAIEVLRGAAAWDVGGATVRVPTPEHLVVHHILHSQLHDSYHERIWPSMRTVYDMCLLQRRFGAAIDWQHLEKRFREKRQWATLALYLAEVHRLFGEVIPVDFCLSGMLKVRSHRRQLLQKYPVIRWADPSFYYLAGWKPRTRRVGEILAQPRAWPYLLRKMTSKRFYTRLTHDFQ